MSNHHDLIEIARSEGPKLTPGVTVGGASIFGFPLPSLVMYATAIYYTILVITLLRDKWYLPWKEKRGKRG